MPRKPAVIVACGGGRHNPVLMQNLRELMQIDVISAEKIGLNGDALEAEAWAYLALRSLAGLPISFPGTTGVPKAMSGGVLARPE